MNEKKNEEICLKGFKSFVLLFILFLSLSLSCFIILKVKYRNFLSAIFILMLKIKRYYVIV
jgi:hypothetical protein